MPVKRWLTATKFGCHDPSCCLTTGTISLAPSDLGPSGVRKTYHMTDADENTSQASVPWCLLDHPILGPLPPAAQVSFTLDGMPMVGRDGEPFAAALLAAGVRVFRTMPRSGEMRGEYCLVGRCSDCLMTIDGVTNVRTCLEPVRAGARVVTQRGVGSWGSSGDGSSENEPVDTSP